MCGIAGIISKNKIQYETIFDMVHCIKYRGPDDIGFYLDGNIGLGHSRLSIMDPGNGKQPAADEHESIIVIFNGEIYNYLVLKKELAGKGHVFCNNSDTAILPHMYEEYGLDMFRRLNGQFAIAILDKKEGKLILGRDRLGEKPLYYFHRDDTFCFASEAKAIFKSGLINAELSPAALKQVFTYWTTLSNRSIFENIFQVPQGCYLVYRQGEKFVKPYWSLTYNNNESHVNKDIDGFVEDLDHKLRSSVKGRMMSDVPISFYLSGGLDSSLITGIAAGLSSDPLNTFSIAFDDVNYDESAYQDLMSRYLGTNHKRVVFSTKDIPLFIKDVIFHTEMPLLRSGAFPMYVLARLVRDNNTKVVLSGEGSDELFGGYDIFREVKIREFCSRNPDSDFRASLFRKVNNFVRGLDNQPVSSLSMYYGKADTQSWFGSHAARWRLGAFSQQFFSSEYREKIKDYDEIRNMEDLLPEDFMEWTSFQRAQYLEISLFFSNYLLSSQGDRVSMAAGVECRYPFLDYDIVEFANTLPDKVKIKALNEKYIVKKLASRYLPEQIIKRKKFPYRAPINIPEFMKNDYIREMLSQESLKRSRVFNPLAVDRYLSQIVAKGIQNERDNMLFMGIATTQILYDLFVA